MGDSEAWGAPGLGFLKCWGVRACRSVSVNLSLCKWTRQEKWEDWTVDRDERDSDVSHSVQRNWTVTAWGNTNQWNIVNSSRAGKTSYSRGATRPIQTKVKVRRKKHQQLETPPIIGNRVGMALIYQVVLILLNYRVLDFSSPLGSNSVPTCLIRSELLAMVTDQTGKSTCTHCTCWCHEFNHCVGSGNRGGLGPWAMPIVATSARRELEHDDPEFSKFFSGLHLGSQNIQKKIMSGSLTYR